DAGKSERADVARNVVVQKSAELAAELQRVPAVQVTECIGYYKSCVAASLRETGGTAEVQPDAADADLRNADGLVEAVVDSQVGRVELLIRREDDVDAVKAEARFIDRAGAEDMRLVQGEDLAARGARVAEIGNRVALQNRLAALVPLDRVIAMQAIIFTERVTDISRPLI